MRQIISILFVILLVAFFSSCTKDSDGTKTTQTEKTVQQQDPSVAPEKQELSGDKVDPNEPDYYPGGPRPTGVYKNGDKGFNFNFAKNDLLDEIKGNWGVTKKGTYFCLKQLVDDGNIKGNPAQIKISGLFNRDSRDRWRWVDPQVRNVDGKDYYVFDNAAGPISDKNDNILFCFWYYGTHFFFPHEGVKVGVFQVASQYAL